MSNGKARMTTMGDDTAGAGESEQFYDAEDGDGQAVAAYGAAGSDNVLQPRTAAAVAGKRVSSMPGHNSGSNNAGRQQQPSVYADLQAHLAHRGQIRSPERERRQDAQVQQQRDRRSASYSSNTGSSTAAQYAGRELPAIPSANSQPVARQHHHQHVPAASSSAVGDQRMFPTASTSQQRPQLPTIPLANGDVVSPVPQRRIAIPDNDAGSASSSAQQPHSQAQQHGPSSSERKRPDSFFGALDNAPSSGVGLGGSRLGPGSATAAAAGVPSNPASRGPSPSSSYVPQARQPNGAAQVPRPNSFFGALDSAASSAEEPQASRSYLSGDRSSQQRSDPTPPPPGAALSPRSMAQASLPTLRTQSQPSQPRYSHVSQYQQHAQQASTSSSSASTYQQQQQQSYARPSINGVSEQPVQRSSFYGLDGHIRSDSDAAFQHNTQSPLEMVSSNSASGFRSTSRSDRAGSPSSRHMSTSLPRSDTGHYTNSSLSGQSSDMFGAHQHQHQQQQRRSRLPSASWSNSNPSSVYGLNAISSQVGAANGDHGLPSGPSMPVLSQAHLRPGEKVSLLSHQKTLELYRANVKKTNDPEITYELALFMLSLARELGAQEQQQQGSSGSNQVSEENLLASNGLPDHSASPSPDPSVSFHSRSSGSSGDLAAGLAAIASGRKRTSHSPASGSAQSHGGNARNGGTSSPTAAGGLTDRKSMMNEAMALLKRNADRGHNPSQYFLADCYAQGNAKRNSGPPSGANVILGAIAEKGSNGAKKADYDKALPLYISAAKHGHSPSCFKAGQCCEYGWGCRKDAGKAVQFYTKAAAASYPQAMYRLGMAELNGELGLANRKKEGFKWLKRVAELAESSSNSSLESPPEALADDPNSPGSGAAARQCAVQALHELALLHERGIDNVVFVDNEYAAELLARASELGYAPSAYKLGECYEYGRMGCPQDSALSIHYYNIAAQQNHREACFALTAWYLVGSPGVLPQSDTEAYLWAKKAAEQGLSKAEYAVGYFTEVGIGTHRDEREALQWFRKAADHGDKRAIARLRSLTNGAENYPSPPTSPTSPNGTVGNNRLSTLHPGKEGKRSRRATLLGMSNAPQNGVAGQHAAGAKSGRKADGDCIIA